VHPREGSLRRPILVPLPHLSKCIELVFKSCAIENLIVPVFTMRARVIMPLSPPTARQDSRRTSTSNPPRPGISHEGTRKGGERTRRGGEGERGRGGEGERGGAADRRRRPYRCVPSHLMTFVSLSRR